MIKTTCQICKQLECWKVNFLVVHVYYCWLGSFVVLLGKTLANLMLA